VRETPRHQRLDLGPLAVAKCLSRPHASTSFLKDWKLVSFCSCARASAVISSLRWLSPCLNARMTSAVPAPRRRGGRAEGEGGDLLERGGERREHLRGESRRVGPQP
jgi:hypothetical protein